MDRHPSPIDELSHDTNPPIASPVLKRKTDPKSHLHLMCDILPCPHQDKYHTNLNIPHEADDDTKAYRQYLVAERPDIDKQKDKAACARSKSQKNLSHKVAMKSSKSSNFAVDADKQTGKSSADSKQDGEKSNSENGERRSKVRTYRRGESEAPVPKYSSSPKGPREKYTVKDAIGEVSDEMVLPFRHFIS